MDLGFPDDNSVRFRSGGLTVDSRLVYGRFRDGVAWFLPIHRFASRFPVGPFRRAVEQAAVFRSEDSRCLSLSFSEALLSIASASVDVGDTAIEYPVEWPHDPLRICLDSLNLLGMLRSFDDDVVLTFGFTDTTTGLRIESADGFLGSIALMNQG
jgi:DNA polymerase III sliding clamp (beta) subunit (PCNA family)